MSRVRDTSKTLRSRRAVRHDAALGDDAPGGGTLTLAPSGGPGRPGRS